MSPYLHTLDEYYADFDRKSFLQSYLINPRLSLHDVLYFIVLFLFISLLRLFIAGINNNKKKSKSGKILEKICNDPLLDKINRKYKISMPTQLYKWKENIWFCLWHTFSFSYNLIVLLSMSGFFNNKNGWVKMCLKEPTGKWFFLVTPEEYSENKKGWPYMYTVDTIYYFYILQIAYWASCLLFLKFETKRKDFYVFVLHHVSTITLLTFSHFLNFWRVGLVILLVHDVVDMFLYASKTINYCTCKKDIVLSVFYALFVFSYFFFRIYLYFFYLVLPLSNMDLIREYTDHFIHSMYDVPGGLVLTLLLWILMCMHIYWFILIMKMTYIFIGKMAKPSYTKDGIKEHIQDIRSDSEDDSCESPNEDDTSQHKKKK